MAISFIAAISSIDASLILSSKINGSISLYLYLKHEKLILSSSVRNNVPSLAVLMLTSLKFFLNSILLN